MRCFSMLCSFGVSSRSCSVIFSLSSVDSDWRGSKLDLNWKRSLRPIQRLNTWYVVILLSRRRRATYNLTIKAGLAVLFNISISIPTVWSYHGPFTQVSEKPFCCPSYHLVHAAGSKVLFQDFYQKNPAQLGDLHRDRMPLLTVPRCVPLDAKIGILTVSQ